MKYRFHTIIILITVFLLTGCEKQLSAAPTDTFLGQTAKVSQSETFRDALTIPEIFIHAAGDTLETRIFVPKGYVRIPAEEGSFAEFLREYSLKEDQSPILLYNGQEKPGHSHQAVFALPIEAEDLQQCADSVMRVYAEYLYWSGQPEKIAFHFTNGFLAKYSRWRDGGRIVVRGKSASWKQSASYDDSYQCFQRYLRTVFVYAGTISMESESREISPSELQAGDVFLKGGSPGHVVMVVDVCENEEGKKAFLLGQGHMPAQEFHLLKNPLHRNNPWYYEEEISYPFVTPDYLFPEGSLRRLCYLDED
ncbi:MAG: DUF4846 domain-containing protein [Lachnoclostridium sp.]|nr:DUF4846 domain-containing protein [Lachnospira sp.]MCM1248830.1 DUF4846 domain-containing protein [Lachnoclostridium sp.]